MHVRYACNYSTSHHREHLIIYIFRSRLTWLTSDGGGDDGARLWRLSYDAIETSFARALAQLLADVAHEIKTLCNLCRMAGNWVVSSSADGIAIENREYISAKWTATRPERLHSKHAECGRQSLASANWLNGGRELGRCAGVQVAESMRWQKRATWDRSWDQWYQSRLHLLVYYFYATLMTEIKELNTNNNVNNNVHDISFILVLYAALLLEHRVKN